MLAATVSEYVLTGHETQVAAVVADILTEYLPTVQSVQASFPTTDLNFPATHARQPTPVKPALHTQSSIDLLPLKEVTPAGHDKQAGVPLGEL